MSVIRETSLDASTDARINCLIEIAFMYREDLDARLAVEPAALSVMTARHFGDPKLLRRALSVLAVVLAAVGDEPGGLRAGCEAYKIALDHDPATAPYVLHNLASVLLEFGCYEVGLDALRTIAGVPTPAGASFSAMAWSTHAHGALVLGHLDEGFRAAASSLNDLQDVALHPANRRTLCYTHSTRARLLCAAGRFAEAADAIDTALQFASNESPIELAAARSSSVLLLAYQGRRDEAVDASEKLLQATRDDYLAFRSAADAVGMVYRICADEHAWGTLQREHTVYLREHQFSVMNRTRDLYLSRVSLVPDTRLPDFVVQGSDSNTLDVMAEQASVDEAVWLDMAVSMSHLRIEETHVRPFRLGALATLLARCAGRKYPIDPELLGKSARLCDLGMLCLPPALVRPNDMRSTQEQALMRRYSDLGSSLLSRSRIAHRQLAESVVRHHTERFDGRGEPDGLRGAAIPFAARLVAVARAIDDAMVGTDGTKREFVQAVNIVKQRCPLEFDPELVERLATGVASAQSVADKDIFQGLDRAAPPNPVVELRRTLRTDHAIGAQAPRFSHGVSAVSLRSARLRLAVCGPVLHTVNVSSKYRSNRNVVFSCKYHVVWCPKYRRSVLVDGADEALKRIVERVCLARNAQLIELEVMPDHVHLLVDIDPQYGIHRLIKEVKGTSSRELRASFPFLKRRLPTLWTNSYFVSTVGGAPLAVVKQYIENQKHV